MSQHPQPLPGARGLLGILVLAGLIEGDAHGYEIIRRIERLTDGKWRPAPGALYPLMNALEKEGFIECYQESGKTGRIRKVCRITDEGLKLFVETYERLLILHMSIVRAVTKVYCTALKRLNEKMDRVDTILKHILEAINESKDYCIAEFEETKK